MTGKGRRRKGIDFEQQIAAEFREMDFSDAITARAGDRSKDSGGVDIINTGEFNVQCKCNSSFKNPIPALEKMKDLNGINLLIQKVNHKGTFVVIPWEQFKQKIAASTNLEREERIADS